MASKSGVEVKRRFETFSTFCFSVDGLTGIDLSLYLVTNFVFSTNVPFFSSFSLLYSNDTVTCILL